MLLTLVKTCFCCLLLFSHAVVAQPMKPVFVLDGDSIYEYEIKLRQKINAAQPGMDSSDEVAAYQLLRALAYRNIATRNHVPLTAAVLDAESKRIDMDTRMPGRIKALRKLCQTETAYKKYYVLPDFSERWLYYNFQNNPYIHHYGKGIYIQQKLNEVLQGQLTFNALATCYQANVDTLILDNSGTPIPYSNVREARQNGLIDLTQNVPDGLHEKVARQMNFKDSLTRAQLFYTVISKLSVGEVHAKVIFMPDCFMLVKLLSNQEGKTTILTIAIPKLNFDEWVEKQCNALRLQVFDTVLYKKMKPGNYPVLEWLKTVN